MTCAHAAHAHVRARRASVLCSLQSKGCDRVTSHVIAHLIGTVTRDRSSSVLCQFVNAHNKEKPPVIEMVSRSGEPEAMLCPALVCDTCRQQVTGHGNVVWAMRHAPQWDSSPLFVSHKGRCDQALKRRIDAEYPLADGWSELWDEVGDFMRHLTHNAVQSFADDTDGTYRIVPVIHPGKD